MTVTTHYTERRDALWKKCTHCNEPVFNQVLERNFYACPHCGHYSPMPADARLRHLFDSDPLINLHPLSAPENLLESLELMDFVSQTTFPGEQGQLTAAGEGTISGNPAILVVVHPYSVPQRGHFVCLPPSARHCKKNTRLSQFFQAMPFLRGSRMSRCNPN